MAMKALLCIIVGLGAFGIRWGASADDDAVVDSFDYVILKNSSDENELYLETTRISVDEDDPTMSYKDYFVKPEPLVSDPLFQEDGPWNISAFEELRFKRFLPEEGFTHENKMLLLQLHNIYRGNVTPPAGDMSYMEWDDELAKLAQIWSDGCNFTHGMPDNDFGIPPGQNLYIGTDPTGYLGLKMWFEEHRYYDHRKDYCIPTEQCGHYKQMVWSQSKKLGCAMTKCDSRFLITCHYYPPAYVGIPIFRVAKPCSQCPDKKGSLCLENLCMTWEQCKNNPFDCKFAKCDLECQNCGKLDKEKCLCECADGWDSPDCSHLCADKHNRCGKSPGWPTKATCSMNRYAVAHTYCRKMCDMCSAVNTSVSNNTCCDGKLCDNGFVLDTHSPSCKCALLCPGPQCDEYDDQSEENVAALKSTVSHAFRVLPCTLYSWIVVFVLLKRTLWTNC